MIGSTKIVTFDGEQFELHWLDAQDLRQRVNTLLTKGADEATVEYVVAYHLKHDWSYTYDALARSIVEYEDRGYLTH